MWIMAAADDRSATGRIVVAVRLMEAGATDGHTDAATARPRRSTCTDARLGVMLGRAASTEAAARRVEGNTRAPALAVQQYTV